MFIIDVSQSVEQDHPSAFDFLRSDIRNVEDFFTRRSSGEVKTLGLRRAFSFIVDESVGLSREEEGGDEGEDRLLDVLKVWLDREAETEKADVGEGGGEGEAKEDATEAKAKAEVDDAVFFSSYIPRSLGEVYDPERDIDILKAGKGDTLIYAGITKLDINEGKEAASTEAGPVEAEAEANALVAGAVEEAEDRAAVEEGAKAAKAEPEEAEDVELGEDGEAKPAARRPSKSVRWADEAEAEDEEDEEEPDYDRKPRGFRHEDRDAKKVSS